MFMIREIMTLPLSSRPTGSANNMKKSTIIIIAIIAVAGIIYFYFSGSSSSTSATLGATGATSDQVGTQVLALLNQIQSLKIDSSFFTDPAYRTLRDYSVTVPPGI